jgi:hypothetical protein
LAATFFSRIKAGFRLPFGVLTIFGAFSSTFRADCTCREVVDVLVIAPPARFAKEEERSAALPSGEGAAALLGVLASWFEVILRNYSRWAPFRAGPQQDIAIGFRANLFDSRFVVHPTCPLPS